MPFKRASRLGGLYLTPPSLLTFVISLVLAILAIGSLYTHIPGIGTFVCVLILDDGRGLCRAGAGRTAARDLTRPAASPVTRR